jgi:hypothetical protein
MEKRKKPFKINRKPHYFKRIDHYNSIFQLLIEKDPRHLKKHLKHLYQMKIDANL